MNKNSFHTAKVKLTADKGVFYFAVFIWILLCKYN